MFPTDRQTDQMSDTDDHGSRLRGIGQFRPVPAQTKTTKDTQNIILQRFANRYIWKEQLNFIPTSKSKYGTCNLINDNSVTVKDIYIWP